MPAPTIEQQRILDEQQNCAVIATPGSGKTFTISEKIRGIIKDEPPHRGVVAISYTNKASDELRHRALLGGVSPKGSFFGTIDKFQLSEIIFPFGPRVFGRPSVEPQIVKFQDLEPADCLGLKVSDVAESIFGETQAAWYSGLFCAGRIVLECSGGAAVWVLTKSAAARRYLKSRYSWVFIDEYQDCGFWQHRLFTGMCTRLGLRGVAVGDINQSIYGFAKKFSKYLESLVRDPAFRVHPLTANHRSPPSIVNYATRLLARGFVPLPSEENRVFYRRVKGDEVQIGLWIGQALPSILEQYGITSRNRVGILVRGSRTSDLVSVGLTERGIQHRLREETSLDRDSSPWGALFRSLLAWLCGPEVTKYEVVDQYLDVARSRGLARRVLEELRVLEEAVARAENVSVLRDLFVAIARSLIAGAENRGAVGALMSVLSSPAAVSSYAPVAEDEVHLMTLHKSKGLEFDVVFHLDMYEHILPQFNGDERQDLNLHYVGITRARQACFLCGSTQRHKASGEVIAAGESPFLSRNGLPGLRGTC